ncbi:hypothetical protein [Brevibacterium litoralis]|uniref:hypothetical protein n=1 Tax=Brevibacterium litoralis TaxID=3138935 RepID=UPI0032EB0D37
MSVWLVLGVCAAVFVMAVVVAAAWGLFDASPLTDRFDEVATDPGDDLRRTTLPADVRSTDLDGLRFPPALRGYRAEDVDRVITVLAARLAEYEAREDAPATSGESGQGASGADVGEAPGTGR